MGECCGACVIADTAQELVAESAVKVAADDEGGRASQGSRDHVA